MREAKKPDLNGPRYRIKKLNTISKEEIEKLKEKIPKYKSYSYYDIIKIIKTFNKILWQKVIENRYGVEIPHQIGHMFIGTCPPKKKPNVDFKISAEYLKVIQHRNWESDQYLAKIFFTTYPTKYKYRNHNLWGFTACREFKRTLGKEYPKKWNYYIMVDPHKKISHIYVLDKRNEIKMEKNKQIKDYNEFDI